MITAYSAYGPSGASTRVRLYDWFDHLGIETERHAYLGRRANRGSVLVRHPLQVARAERDLRRLAHRADDRVAIVSREVSPLSTGRLEAAILSGAALGVFDFDDAIYLARVGPRRWLDQERKARWAAEAADVVIAGNDVLAEWASQHSNDVTVIPSCVEPEAYKPKTAWGVGGTPRLVWLGSPSTEQYVVDIAPALEKVWRATGAILTVISGPAHSQRELDQWSHFIRRVEWGQGVAREQLAAADVAIAPLRDDPYARGKCAYKLLQYAASALPMVGSPVGANLVALERFEGISATSHETWTDGIISILGEAADDRARRGRAGLAAVREHYSFGAWADSWRRAVGISSA